LPLCYQRSLVTIVGPQDANQGIQSLIALKALRLIAAQFRHDPPLCARVLRVDRAKRRLGYRSVAARPFQLKIAHFANFNSVMKVAWSGKPSDGVIGI
jgi:hypothetical protein